MNSGQEDISFMTDSDLQNPEPIQKNAKLFKFILYTSKVEIRFNSLIKLIYNTSLLEFSIWILGFFLFLASPSEMYLIWILTIHIGKGIFGFIFLNYLPKTQDIMEGVAKNPNFKEDTIIDLIKNEIKNEFMGAWAEHKNKFFAYLLLTLMSLLIDLIIFLVQIIKWGSDIWILNQTCMLFSILIFIVSDVVYFLWYFTMPFTFPNEILVPVKNALFGSVKELRALFRRELKTNEQERNVQVA